MTDILRRRAADALLKAERRAAQLEHRGKGAEHRLEIEQHDNVALRAHVTWLVAKLGVPQ